MPYYGPGTVEDGTTSVSTQLALMLSQLIDNLSQGEYTPADESVTTEKLAADVIAALAAKADDVDLDALEATLTAALAGKQDTLQPGTYAGNAELAALLDPIIVGAITRDANGAATAASVAWPDGATGAYTALVVSTAFPGSVDSYRVTHVLGGVTTTYTQPTITRDASTGAVTNRPAITVA